MKYFLFFSIIVIFFNISAYEWEDPCKPVFVRVSFPENDASSVLGFAWNTRDLCETVAYLRDESGKNERVLKGMTVKGNGSLGYIHTVIAEGLEPDTFYTYQVGGKENISAEYKTKTAPLENSCSRVFFALASDSRPNGITDKPEAWKKITSEAVSENGRFDFIINGGDLVDDGTDDQYLDFLDYSTHFFGEMPLMIALGNHDDGPVEGYGANYNQIFHYPKNSATNTEDSYYFRYGSVLLISFSTSTYTDLFPQTVEWMENIIEENSDALWKIVVNHHPFYSSMGRGADVFGVGHEPNEVGQNPYFIPVFDKHHVDVVISAHSHYYERFEPSFGVGETEPSKIETQPAGSFENGTVYIISGGGGAMTYTNAIISTVCGVGAMRGSQSCAGENHYMTFSASNNELEIETWSTTHQILLDLGAHKKIDGIKIIKNNAECVNEETEETDDDDLSSDSFPESSDEAADETVEPFDNNIETDDTDSEVQDKTIETQDDPIPDENIDSSDRSGCSIFAI